MSYKNSVKLLASNFTLVWKQLLYLFICAVIFSLCAYATIEPIISLLSQNGVFSEFKFMVETAYSTPSGVALQLSELTRHILNVIFIENFSAIWAHLIALVIFVIFLPFILVQMSFFNITSILYQKLSMNMNVGFLQNGFKTWRSALAYAASNILFNIPFFALNIVMIELYLMIAKTVLSAIIGLIILVLILIIVKSYKFSLFSCYTAHMVETSDNPFKSFGKGFLLSCHRFWKILSTSIIITLTIILINGFVALFTFFSGLLVSIPATFVFIAIYYLVTYFSAKGDRYYLGNNLIYNPTAYTIKQSDAPVLPNIPEVPEKQQLDSTVMKKTYKTKKLKVKKNNKVRKENGQ